MRIIKFLSVILIDLLIASLLGKWNSKYMQKDNIENDDTIENPGSNITKQTVANGCKEDQRRQSPNNTNRYEYKEIETTGSIIGNRGSTTRSIINIGDQDQYSNRHDGSTGKENDSGNTRSKERDDRENSKSRENTNELHHTVRNKNRNPKYHIREEFYSDQGFKQYSQFGKRSDDNNSERNEEFQQDSSLGTKR
jgi:hypothetical protein